MAKGWASVSAAIPLSVECNRKPPKRRSSALNGVPSLEKARTRPNFLQAGTGDASSHSAGKPPLAAGALALKTVAGIPFSYPIPNHRFPKIELRPSLRQTDVIGIGCDISASCPTTDKQPS
ncbi:MAG: hypothetical protein M2R45_01053 [Verrucomicrobia subdivision 3 bacterium]|nr:hypothetical protein [Limisphaerales bacterium]MCS1414166.1 hypothetical protein [Limisphaerales bacterium]